jgi:hypothetical protein
MMQRCLLAATLALPVIAQSPEGLEFFEKKIRPVLTANCYSCHSAAAKNVMGGLQVDSRRALERGGKSGVPAVVSGKPEDSLILAVMRHTGPVKMPPGRKLSDEILSDFEAWIRMGAPDPREGRVEPLPPPYDYSKARQHWAYQPVRDPLPPAIKDTLWNKTAIDRFIKAKLDEKQLAPAGIANKRALIRRATYDLTGLPPTPEDVAEFVNDTSPNAFARVVDRLLASPQYGEKWGRHWLDVVRYADTAGCNSDFPLPDAWRYRNWVISSFNTDKPYMRFLREQIAGDLLPAKDAEDRQSNIIGTTYLAISRRFASNKNEHHLTIDDTIDNIGKGMLGLTLSCARCHDHKFDAIPQRDYFGLYGIFESTIYTFPGVETVPRPHDFVALDPANQPKLDEWEDRIKDAYAQIRELRFGAGRNRPDSKQEIDRLKSQVLAVEINPPAAPKAYAVKEGYGHSARMHYKGDPKKLGDEAPRKWLTVLGGGELLPYETGSGRLTLADWITSRENPLTARVMVNRIWQWHFGRGLAATPNDFGTRGEQPAHPELLDWLTTRFVESGYSVKAMHRLIMLSRAWRLSTSHNEANAKLDPGNSYLWRFNRRRLEAEEIRDSLLHVSGRLDPVPGGAHPFPPVHQWNYSQHRQFFATYDHNKRSVYLMQQRLRRHPLLELFDSADPNASTGARNSSITPLQALATMNNELVHSEADAFAIRIGMAHNTTAARIRFAHQVAFGRPATPAEVLDGTAYLMKADLALKKSDVPWERRQRSALASYLRVLLSSDEFFFVD